MQKYQSFWIPVKYADMLDTTGFNFVITSYSIHYTKLYDIAGIDREIHDDLFHHPGVAADDSYNFV